MQRSHDQRCSCLAEKFELEIVGEAQCLERGDFHVEGVSLLGDGLLVYFFGGLDLLAR